MRVIVREAEKALDGADPKKIWEQFAAQLEEQAAAAVAANFLWATQRAGWLGAQVAELFEEDGAESLPQLRTGNTAVPKMPAELEQQAGEKFGVGQQAFVGLRGGYMGTLMAGMASTLIGMTLLNPFSAAAGLLMGGKMVRERAGAYSTGAGWRPRTQCAATWTTFRSRWASSHGTCSATCNVTCGTTS